MIGQLSIETVPNPSLRWNLPLNAVPVLPSEQSEATKARATGPVV